MALGQRSNGEALPHISLRVWELDVLKHPPRICDMESWKWQLILTADPAGQEQKARALRWLYPSSPEYIIYSTRTSDTWEIFIFVFLLQNSNT